MSRLLIDTRTVGAANKIVAVPLYLIHIWLPVLLGPAFAVALARHWDLPLRPWGLVVLIAGALAVYTGDRVLERAARLTPMLRRILLLITVIAVLLCVGIGLWQRELLLPLLVLAAIAAAYPLLKRIPAGKALLVGCSWTLAIVILPFAHTWLALLDLEFLALLQPESVAIVLLISAGTVLCDLKDRDEDARRGIRTLVVLMGSRYARLVAAGMLIAAAGFAVNVAFWSPLPSAVLLLALCCWPGTARPIHGPLLVDAVLLLVLPAGLIMPT